MLCVENDLREGLKLGARNLELCDRNYLQSILETLEKSNTMGYLTDEEKLNIEKLVDNYKESKKLLLDSLSSLTVDVRFCTFEDMVKELNAIKSDDVAKRLFKDYISLCPFEEAISLMVQVPKCISYIANLDLSIQLELVTINKELYKYIRNPYKETEILYKLGE